MLEYEGKLAPNEKQIIANAIRFNRPIPDRIKNAPEIDDGNRFFYVAFFDLTTTRYYELGPIPYTEVIKYAHINGMSDLDDIEFLWDVIRRVDDWAIKDAVREIKQSNGEGGKGQKSR